MTGQDIKNSVVAGLFDGETGNSLYAQKSAQIFDSFFADQDYDINGTSGVFLLTDGDASSLGGTIPLAETAELASVTNSYVSGFFNNGTGYGGGVDSALSQPVSGPDGILVFDSGGNIPIPSPFTITDGFETVLIPQARQLIASDGATLQLEWSDPGLLQLGSGVDFQDSTGNSFESLFDGSGGFVGLAISATNAENDGFGNEIDSTYLKISDIYSTIFTSDAAHFVDGTGAFQAIASLLASEKVVTNAAPTTGQTVNAAGVDQDELIYIQPAGTLLALTIQLEPGGGVVADIGDIKEIFISQIITGLTVSATGGTVRGTALTTSSAVNGSYEYCKVTSTDWLRIR